MIKELAIAYFMGACPTVDLVNNSKEPWTADATDVIITAKRTCAREYKKCLKKLIKREPRVYWAICGTK